MSEGNKKGCFFWGCLVLIIIGLIIGLLLFLAYRKIKNTVNEFTSPTPVAIQPIDYTSEEKTEAKQKAKDFINEIKAGKEAAKEEFTDKELNILIETDKELAGKAQVTFEGNKIKAKLNIPLKNIPIVDGRYLAGDAELKVACENGDLDIQIESFEVNGKPVPEDIMKELRKENIAQRMQSNPKAGPYVKRLKTVRMKDNKLLIEMNPK